jgi:hypothetical protein
VSYRRFSERCHARTKLGHSLKEKPLEHSRVRWIRLT